MSLTDKYNKVEFNAAKQVSRTLPYLSLTDKYNKVEFNAAKLNSIITL